MIQLPGSLYSGVGVTKGEDVAQRPAFKEGHVIDECPSIHCILGDRPLIEDNGPELIGLTLSNSADSILLLLAP